MSNNSSNQSLMDDNVRQALFKLTSQIKAHPTIQRFQQVQQQVDHSQVLRQLQHELETAQKEIVNAQHFNKPLAQSAAVKRADELKQALDTHPLTIAYRNALYDANELLTYLVDETQIRLNQALQLKAILPDGDEE